MNAGEAIAIVAHHAIRAAVEDRIGEMWEDYPEIGDDDWGAVVEAALTIVATPADYEEAYKILADRAEHTAEAGTAK